MTNMAQKWIIKQIFLFALIVGTQSIFSQSQSITGTISDESGEPLPGVSIVVKGTTRGAVTNLEGQYTVEAEDPTSVLVFSYVGYLTQEITVGNQTVIDIALEADVYGLEEVVVIGYGTVKKSDLTGSVVTIDGEEFEDKPISSFEQGLQGRAAGVTVTQSSGAPGAGISVLVRGGNSILGGNQPLYVVDGFPIYNNNNLYKGGDSRSSGFTQSVPLNVLSSLNPGDIESIEILKDASATAIYGSRGANGVVLITTKQGKERTGTIEFEAYYGTQTADRILDLPTAKEYGEYLNLRAEVLREAGNPNEDNVYTQQELDNLENFDYQDYILRTASIQNYQLSMRGGGDRSTYAISGNYFDQEGIVKGSGFNRYSIRANVGGDFAERFHGGMNFSASRVESDMAATEGGQEQSRSMTRQVSSWPAIIPPYDDEGNYMVREKIDAADYIPAGVNTTWSPPENSDSPVLLLNEFDDNQVIDKLLGNLYLSYRIADGLILKISGGADVTRSKRDIYWSSHTQYGKVDAISGGQATTRNDEKVNYLNENTLSYNKTIGGIHSLNAVAGFTNQSEVYESRRMTARGFVTDIPKNSDMGGGSQIPEVSSNKWKWSMQSFLGRVNYVLDNRYLFTLTARADGSSKFSEGNKWGFFPAAALGWRLSEESFLQNVEFISNMKVRGSWGITGNQEIGTASALATFASTGYSVGGTPVTGLEPRGVDNPDLVWEKTAQINIGLDFGVFANRVVLTADYYTKKTEDLLLEFPLPPSRGISDITKNSGSLENKGFEMQLSSNVLSGTFKWRTTVNFFTNKNNVTDLGGIKAISAGRLAGAEVEEPVYILENQPVGIFYGLKMDGLFENLQEVQDHTTTLDDGTVVVLQDGALPGSPRIVDINQDGVVDLDDRTVIGSPYPDFTFGWSNNFSYRNFDLSFFIQGVQGIDIHNVLGKYTAPRRITEVWPNGKYPRPGASQNTFTPNPLIGALDIQDGSFIRMSDLTLGYDIPLAKVSGIRAARIYVSAKNLFTITSYDGYNPDVNSTVSTTFVRGVDSGAYPTARTFIFGIRLGF